MFKKIRVRLNERVVVFSSRTPGARLWPRPSLDLGRPRDRAALVKELDTLKEIAQRIHNVHLIVGADGLKTFLPGGLLREPLERG